MDDLTISEVAEKLEVTKQCIYNKLKNLKRLKPFVYKKAGVRYITSEGFNIINDSLNNEVNSKDVKDVLKDETNYITEMKTMYEDRIKELKKENENRINDLKEEIANLRDESRIKNELISSIQRESEGKNDLLKNMQILIKEKEENSKKVLLDKKRTRWWQFKK